MATIEQLQAELAQVNTAISAAYGSAEYDIESGNSRRRLKRQSLDLLLRRRAEIEASIDRLSGNGSRGVRHSVPC